jgi:hypothetical protein
MRFFFLSERNPPATTVSFSVLTTKYKYSMVNLRKINRNKTYNALPSLLANTQLSFFAVKQRNITSNYDKYNRDVGNGSAKPMKLGQSGQRRSVASEEHCIYLTKEYSSAKLHTLFLSEARSRSSTKKPRSLKYYVIVFIVLLPEPNIPHYFVLPYCDMTAKVGIVEQEEAVIVRQGHDKHVSEVADTDAIIEYAVLSVREFVATAL